MNPLRRSLSEFSGKWVVSPLLGSLGADVEVYFTDLEYFVALLEG
jgi:hypothetical protein